MATKEKRYRACIYVDIDVPDNDTWGYDENGNFNKLRNHSKENAEWVAQNICSRLPEKYQRVGYAYVNGVADRNHMEQLLKLGT